MNKLAPRVPEKVEIDQSSYSSSYAKFILAPLEKGYGVTVGNSLRRVLLNSIPGSAITSIRMNDVQHEFSTIKGVKEDISDIVMNLKEIRSKLIDIKSERISMEVKGPGDLTAGDIGKQSNQLEILNPALHIATLGDEADFTMEIKFERGRGYVPADKNKKPDAPIGTIYIDSIFTPVKFVKFDIEATRVEGKTDFEKLILEVTTDGSITPDDAVSTAARVLREHLELFIFGDEEHRIDEIREEEEDLSSIRKQLIRSIDELELSVRSYNCLKKANIVNLADLVSNSEQEMLKFKNFGRKSLLELQEKLGELGLQFDMDVKKYIGDDDY